ncbi:hypothetical protein [Nocardioides sp. YIM 152315]|uniref:hypothetical protein n=1 Tax=Nocardioides sp. YIM 152315 TaxID=3031760 RepID=UPI0023DCCEFE|nr:hypothetical protein [Nocardioides sp. YIM 152315]MDF1602918.1 hypothetical protein [Nocardioides sp. YIM 152315]
MLPRTRALSAVVLTTALLGLAACGDDTGEPTTSADTTASETPTPSESASAAPTSARTDFCAHIPRAAIEEAILGKSIYDEVWNAGDKFEVVGGAHQEGAEFGCAWTAKDGTSVTAWLFASPVSADEAATLVQQARDGCARRKVPTPGDPAVTVQCINDDDTVTRTQALYGDAWLSCSLQTPGILTRLSRAADWCAAVRDAALV